MRLILYLLFDAVGIITAVMVGVQTLIKPRTECIGLVFMTSTTPQKNILRYLHKSIRTTQNIVKQNIDVPTFVIFYCCFFFFFISWIQYFINIFVK